MLSQLFKNIMNHVACNVLWTELFSKYLLVNSAVSTLYNALQKQLFFLFLKLAIHEDVFKMVNHSLLIYLNNLTNI